MAKKIIQEVMTQTVDHSTGEITEESNHIISLIPSEPPFIKLYLEDIASLYKLPDGTHKVLLELLKKLDYEGKISLNKTNKIAICERIGWQSVASLDNYLSKHLVKKDVFRKEGTGVFIPNPHLFGKGKWQDVYKKREAWLNISYKKDGSKNITSSLNEEEK